MCLITINYVRTCFYGYPGKITRFLLTGFLMYMYLRLRWFTFTEMYNILYNTCLVTITFFCYFCRDVFHVPSIVAIATSACIILLNCNSREPLYILDFQGELLCNAVKLILTMSVTLIVKQLPLVLDSYILDFFWAVIIHFVLIISLFILLHEKFLQSDWLRAVVFQPNLKNLHVKITNLLWVVV